jgi:carbon monoxide dehydrogenase subunit G
MKVEGTRSYSAPRETLWEVLNDPERMAKVMPGVESFDVLDDRNWRAHVLIPLGLGGLRMKINFEKTEERRPEYARLHAKGEGVGALLSMDTQFHLSEEGGATAMRWEADVRVAGPVGSMGQRVLQPIVNQQVQQVLAALDKQVQEADSEPPAGEAPATPASNAEEPPSEPAEAGPPPEKPAGEEGAEAGVHPASPETYSPEPEGPTHSTDG